MVQPRLEDQETRGLTLQPWGIDLLDAQNREISPLLLTRIARAWSSYYSSIVGRFRDSPVYLREQVELQAAHRHELLPDIDGNAPTLKALLDNPRYVGQQTRYLIHDSLQNLGCWSIIVQYMEDVVDLEKTTGRCGVLTERQEILNCVAGMVEQGIKFALERAKRSIVTDEVMRKYWTRIKNHPDWGGSLLIINVDFDDPDFQAIMRSPTLQGACLLFAAAEATLESKPDQHNLLHIHLLTRFSEATTEELLSINQSLSIALSQFKAFHDFLGLLNYSEARLPTDHRYTSFALNTKTVQKILDATTLDRHIANIQSVEKQSVFDKIWRDINTVSQKTCKTRLEQFVGYAPVAPRWYTPPPRFIPPSRRPRPRTPSPSPIIKPSRPRHTYQSTYVEHPPADIKPYYASRGTSRPTSDVQTPPREAPKTKTRPPEQPTTQVETKPQAETQQDTADMPSPLPVFHVDKRTYSVFEMLFKGGEIKGIMSYRDFENALEKIGFKRDPRGGSVFAFIPAFSSDPLPIFIYDRPHGNNTELYPALRHDLTKRLKETYGWEWSWFGLKSDG